MSADCIVVSGGGQRQSAGMSCKVCCESVMLLRHHFLTAIEGFSDKYDYTFSP